MQNVAQALEALHQGATNAQALSQHYILLDDTAREALTQAQAQLGQRQHQASPVVVEVNGQPVYALNADILTEVGKGDLYGDGFALLAPEVELSTIPILHKDAITWPVDEQEEAPWQTPSPP